MSGTGDQRAGLGGWSAGHPIGVMMLALAVAVLGVMAYRGLSVDLLPPIVYPEVRVIVTHGGVPATVMEEEVTKLLEERLAVTEDAVALQSRTSEGRSAIYLSFPYGTDMDAVVREVGVELERARRALPREADPPVVRKRDPSQTPVLQYVVSSALWSPTELRDWSEEGFRKWLLNLPGVAAIDLEGGQRREILVLPDQERLAGLGLSLDDVAEAIEAGNVETPGGRLRAPGREYGSRTAGRFENLTDLSNAVLPIDDTRGQERLIRLGEIAEVVDTTAEERLRVRLDGQPGLRVSVHKQPEANTVEVVDRVQERLVWMRAQGLVPPDVSVRLVSDQAVFIRDSLRNASQAALGGGVLAMLVIWVFLGDLRRTVVVGLVIPLAILATFALMGLWGLSLNLMTIGGLALGIGLLVDNAIVMVENIHRHQNDRGDAIARCASAVREVQSALVASTSTNLAAIVPFLFMGGLVGLLFSELVLTLSVAVLASLLVALTVVPAMAGRSTTVVTRHRFAPLMTFANRAQSGYARALGLLVRYPAMPLLVAVAGLSWAVVAIERHDQTFLPPVDTGDIRVWIRADPGIDYDDMDAAVTQIEQVVTAEPDVSGVLAMVGGYTQGRTSYQSSNRASLRVDLTPSEQRRRSSEQVADAMRAALDGMGLPGVRTYVAVQGIPGIRLGRGDDPLSLRIQGPDLDVLSALADQVVDRLEPLPGIGRLWHSADDVTQELTVHVDRQRAAALGVTVADVGRAFRSALQGEVVSQYLESARSYDIRLRLPWERFAELSELPGLIVAGSDSDGGRVRLGDVAEVRLESAPQQIRRDSQLRIVEIGGRLDPDTSLLELERLIGQALADLALPTGYTLYDGGAMEALREGRNTGMTLLGLALFLVLVVMAVQYESLRKPLVIMASVPFSLIGVAIGLNVTQLPVSMPVWLGLIVLAGIVVNNAIVLVETIGQRQAGGDAVIVEAAAIRLRPILMTTITTVVGMMPLALGWGQGTELLRPLAVTVVSGLSFSLLVSLALVPILYKIAYWRQSARPSRS